MFLAAAEMSLSSANRIRLMKKAEDGVKKADLVIKLLEHSSRFLPTILLLTLLTDTGAAAIAATLANKFLPFGAVVATALVTLLLFIYAEMIPKTFAINNPESVALLVVRPVVFLTTLFYPLAFVFIKIANFFIAVFGGKVASSKGPFFTEEEIKTLISYGEEEGVLEEEEKEMINSIFEFGDTIVKEVMVPRVDMICVDKSATLDKVLEVVIKAGHSRIPVYNQSVDNIVGVVYAKDLLIELNKRRSGQVKGGNGIKKLLRPAYYVPESKPISDLLRELQKKKIHMAIVLDEYGGTAGLVTIEDLLEEIVGEIFDEYDLEEAMVEVVGENAYRIDARADLDEVSEILGVEFPEKIADTIGGLVYNLVGHLPSVGEETSFRNLRFTVEKVMGRRILKILVTKEEDQQQQKTEAGS
jgi:CBS domain containing-hemolysin-like protein